MLTGSIVVSHKRWDFQKFNLYSFPRDNGDEEPEEEPSSEDHDPPPPP